MKMNKFKTKKQIQETKLHAIPRFPAGSFTVHIGDQDHLRSSLGIISGLGIIWSRGSFAELYRSSSFLLQQKQQQQQQTLFPHLEITVD